MKLPCYKTLMTSRDQMVPSGLKVSATHARFPLQSVLNHTAERLAKRTEPPCSICGNGVWMVKLAWQPMQGPRIMMTGSVLMKVSP